jgi:hypothetical protein
MKDGHAVVRASEWVRSWLTGAMLLAMVGGAQAQALPTQTWVSGKGDDANACARVSPCRTLAHALAETASGGWITVLDAVDLDGGATITINKSITIDGAPAAASAIGGVSALDSIVIDAPDAVDVTLRNVTLNGFRQGVNGIRVASKARVLLDQVDVWGYTNSCLQVDASAAQTMVSVSRSSLSHCAVGVANAAAATVEMSEETVVSLNTTAGTQVTHAQGVVMVSSDSRVQQGLQSPTLTPFNSGQSISLTGVDPGCAIASQQFLSPAAAPATAPAGAVKIAGAGFDFESTQCGAGVTVAVTIAYAEPLPENTAFHKYLPATQTWQKLAGAVISADRLSVTYTVADNGPLDEDSTVGVIRDPAWPFVMGAEAAVAIPVASPQALVLLALLLGCAVAMQRRRLL